MTVYTQSAIQLLFRKISSLKIFVVGDAMLDNYWMGSIDRISPEAPVPIVHIHHKESRLGGAANVALNCKTLGTEVFLLTTIGKDPAGNLLLEKLKDHHISGEYCIRSSNRITTTKTRIIAKNQQAIRIDEEITHEMSVRDEHHFIDTCMRAIQIEKPDILIFEDYNKGVLTRNNIQKIISHCKVVGVMTAVDPKLTNFFSYKGVDLFKPNLKEVKEACHIETEPISLQNLKTIHNLLQKQLQHGATMITLSEKGIFAQQTKHAHLFPAFVRQIADVSGAGDTVIAVASILLFLSGDIHLSAQIANLAGGIVCEEPGVVPIQKSKLIQEIKGKLIKK